MESCALVSSEAFVLIGHYCHFLQELDLTDNDVDDEGLKSVSRCSELSVLKLGICLNITDEGLIFIGNGCKKLIELDLYRFEMENLLLSGVVLRGGDGGGWRRVMVGGG
ncbi:putative leucine-rich repeat domain superfamily [Helianthus annuus]|nr:putative leucine-rich repeat domain superfamily [Helianthus annuus]